MKKHYAWVIAFTGTLVLLLSHGFGRMSYSVILPPMKEGLALTYTQIGLIGTGNFIGYLCLAVIGGFLAARFGVRRVVFVSLVVMGISLFLTGLSRSFELAFLMRLVTGMGNGGSYVPMMALPAAWFVMAKRGLATGVVTMGTGIGLSLTGLILPYFMGKYGQEGWRYAWFLMGAIVFVCSFVCYVFLKDSPKEMGLSMYGGEEEQKGGPRVTLFSAWKDVVGEKEIWKLGSVYFMYGFSYIIYLTFFIAYLAKEIGLSPQAAGGIFAVLGFFSIFCGVVWGTISDILGRRYGSVLAYITLALSYLVFAFWKDTTGFYISAVVFGITAFSIPVIMAAAAGDAVGGRLAPAGLGFITLFFGIGQAFGPAVAGWLKDVTGTFTHAFVLSAVISFLGALGSLILKRKT
ncbi:MFS transporter [Syntrophorhabdus aromaticivorans]|uniref:YbfB/YjiJ family MFS transporter n=1 Tax=Syntrophorhabdus aromaticivorans TaxID=328301 RepID=A0A351U1V9_9BACT|nr:MFS transporter [Syntrophorhabdus aromaticivorans]NLW36893.1 YbfB/YjiJ family MFS transporter [Syntrophorhabdus aromaticivorans]HBA53940.1 MFS transporter [Syntrophorhabdus aromaticivorans]